jgi:hypothetical protein
MGYRDNEVPAYQVDRNLSTVIPEWRVNASLGCAVATLGNLEVPGSRLRLAPE